MQILQALILRTIKYGETSLIANSYTKEYGYQSYILKGIRRNKNKRGLSRALFQPTNILEIVAKKYPNNKLGYLTEARLGYHYQLMQYDYQKKTVVLFLFELLYQLLREEGVNAQLYDYITQSLKWYDKSENTNGFYLKFLLEMTKHLGYLPDLSNHDAPYFDFEKALFSHQLPKGKYLEGQDKDRWSYFLGTSFDDLDMRDFSPSERMDMLGNIFDYYGHHFLEFKIPCSLRMLDEVLVE